MVTKVASEANNKQIIEFVCWYLRRLCFAHDDPCRNLCGILGCQIFMLTHLPAFLRDVCHHMCLRRDGTASVGVKA